MKAEIESVFKPEELRAARTETIDEQLKEVRHFARKAPSPVKRVALSELEARLLKMREEMVAQGLVNPEAALVA